MPPWCVRRPPPVRRGWHGSSGAGWLQKPFPRTPHHHRPQVSCAWTTRHPAGVSRWPRQIDGRAVAPPGRRVRGLLRPGGPFFCSLTGSAQDDRLAPPCSGIGDSRCLGSGPSLDFHFLNFFLSLSFDTMGTRWLLWLCIRRCRNWGALRGWVPQLPERQGTMAPQPLGRRCPAGVRRC